VSNVLALNGEIAPAPTVGALLRGVLRRPVELTPQKLPRHSFAAAAEKGQRRTFCRKSELLWAMFDVDYFPPNTERR
jgi:hypothetical protein